MKDKLTSIVEYIKKNANADDYEIHVDYAEKQDTRFAENSITQHITGEDLHVVYKCVKNNKIGKVTTSQTDEENLLSIIKKAEEIADNNSPDPSNTTSLAKEDYPNVCNFYPSINKLDTAKIIEIIKKCVEFAEKKEGKLSGILTKITGETVLATKNGFWGHYKHSNVDFSMTLRKNHIETKVSFGNIDFDKFSIDKLLARLNEQFDSLGEIKDMDYETIPVIMRPQAVMQLFYYLIWFMDRKYADEGLTPFTGQIGKKFLGEKLDIMSTVDDPDLETIPFKQNNVSKSIQWIKDGVIQNMPTIRYWAQKNSLTPCNPFNLVIKGENVSEKEMMKMVKRGLIINNLWYIRVNDMKTFDLTGMTRDGVSYFEDGEIKYAVNNFRFNEQIHELSKRILATGESIQQSSEAKVPTILFDGFTFVDKTTF